MTKKSFCCFFFYSGYCPDLNHFRWTFPPWDSTGTQAFLQACAFLCRFLFRSFCRPSKWRYGMDLCLLKIVQIINKTKIFLFYSNFQTRMNKFWYESSCKLIFPNFFLKSLKKKMVKIGNSFTAESSISRMALSPIFGCNFFF